MHLISFAFLFVCVCVFFRYNESDCDFYGTNDHKMNLCVSEICFYWGGSFIQMPSFSDVGESFFDVTHIPAHM